MRSNRVPSFRPPVLTDGALWMWWLLAASLLRMFGAMPFGTVALAVGAVSFARWMVWTLRHRSSPTWDAPVDGVSDAEVFAIAQVMTMLVMIALGDLAGAAFALVIAGMCLLRAWSCYALRNARRALLA